VCVCVCVCVCVGARVYIRRHYNFILRTIFYILFIYVKFTIFMN